MFWFQQAEEEVVIFRDEENCGEAGRGGNEELALRQVKFHMVIRHRSVVSEKEVGFRSVELRGEAWAGARTLGVISMEMTFRAVMLDEITGELCMEREAN